MKISRINYMKIWLVSNILRNLNYRESFSRKIYFIIKAFQWRNRWSVPREMACWGGVKSTQNINIPENFMLLALPHFEPIFMAIKSNFMMRRHDWNTSPNPFRIRPGDSGGHCTATGLDWTLQFKNFLIFSAAFQPFVQYWWSGWRAFWYPAVTPSYLTLLAGAHFTIVNWKFPSSFCCDSWKLASISVIIRKKT